MQFDNLMSMQSVEKEIARLTLGESLSAPMKSLDFNQISYQPSSSRSSSEESMWSRESEWSLIDNEIKFWEDTISKTMMISDKAIQLSRSNANSIISCMKRMRLMVSKKMDVGQDLCAFCRNNGEKREFYTSHRTRDRQGLVTCPILKRLRCPICGATGQSAHTLKYCPLKTSCLRDL